MSIWYSLREHARLFWAVTRFRRNQVTAGNACESSQAKLGVIPYCFVTECVDLEEIVIFFKYSVL